MLGFALLCLIVLGQAFSDVRRTKPHDRILGCVVVSGPSEDLNSDHTLAKRLVRTRKTVFDNVTKEVLALAAGSKRNTPKDVL